MFSRYQSIFEAALQVSTEHQKYLKSRCVTPESIQKFRIGAANDYYEPLGSFYCSVTVPSINIYNEVVGFFGRRIIQVHPRHVISTDYKKDSNILGLLQSQEDILSKRYVIITEGVFDVIMMHQCGFTNTVGAPGKDWSEKQKSLLRRYTDTIILLFDNDSEGRKATEKYLKEFRDYGFFVTEIKYPEMYKDVDQFLKENSEAVRYLQDKILRRSNIK
jgi:DNA primase